MRARRVIAGAAVLAAALLGNQAVQADPGPRAVLDPRAAQSVLESVAGVPVTVVRDVRGLAHSVGTLPERLIPLPAGSAKDPEAMARAHLTRVGPLFGLTDGARELVVLPQADGLPEDPRDVFVRFQQLRGVLPVLGGELSVVLDRSGGLRSVTGELLPAGEPPGEARVDAAAARETALGLVARKHAGKQGWALRASDPQLIFLDPALVGLPARLGIRGGPVWQVEVADGGLIRHSVLVDADSGQVSFDWNMITWLDQGLCDLKNRPSSDINGPDCTKGNYVTARASGSDAAEGWDNTVRTSRFFENYVNLDLTKLIGLDLGDGKKLRSTVRFCPNNEECALGQSGGLLSNAFWNGRGMYYGDGWTAGDDIVAHELTHGVTEKTSRLLYFFQSGAINESISDIFGELTDLNDGADGPAPQTDWVIGEDAPLTTLPLRVMSNPLLTINPAQPDRMTSAFYDADLTFVDNGGVHTNSGVGNKAGYLLGSGEDFNGQQITTIGAKKIALLFFRVERMLTSGADYQDLAGAMKQGCSDLIGTYGFASTTCKEVSDVIAAVEMTKQPTVELAAAPEAPYCPTGLRGDYVLHDSFENISSRRWTLGNQWIEISEYANHGKRSVWGIEPDTAISSSLTLNDYVPVPYGVSSFLRFDHQYRLDGAPYGPYYDGAKVEYRLPGESSWHVLTAKPWVNGPRKTITPEGGTSYTGFGGNSAGYTSSRVDLTFLAGKKAQFRWRVIGDKQIAYDGWTIDDVRFFTCGADLPSSVGTATITPRRSALNVAWTAPPYVPSGGVSKYRVEVVGVHTRYTKSTTFSTTFGDLKRGKDYTIKITAYNKAGKPGKTATRHGKPA